MSLPATEEAWLKLIGNPRLTRSLFEPTEYCSLVFTSRQAVLNVLQYNVPYRDFVLKPFTAGFSLRDPSYQLWLELSGVSRDVGVRVSFQIKWKSHYLSAKDGLYHYTVRPEAIFVMIPSAPPPAFPAGSPSGPGKRYPGTPQAITGRNLSRVMNNLVNIVHTTRQSKTLPKEAKNGFGGSAYKRPVYPVTVSHSGYDVTYPFNGGPPTVTSGPYEVEEFYKDIVSTSTPNFYRYKRRALPVNPFYCQVRISKDNPGFMSQTTNPGVNRNYFGKSSVTFFGPIAGPVFDGALENKVISKLEKLADADISANLAQDIAQFGQLKSLVTGTCGRITKAITLAKKGDVLGASRALGSPKGNVRKSKKQSVAENWLELQYGWKILLKEIEDLMRVIANTVNDNPPSRSIRASSQSVAEKEYKYLYASNWPESTIQLRTTNRVKIGMRYQVDSQLAAFAQQFGFLNPINLAWEVLPYSFVVDWFVPIGPYLESFSAWQGMSFRDGFKTQYVCQVANCTAFGSKFAAGNTQVGEGSYTRTWVEIQRSKLTSFPRKNLPTPKNPVSLTHALNAIALMTVAFKR